MEGISSCGVPVHTDPWASACPHVLDCGSSIFRLNVDMLKPIQLGLTFTCFFPHFTPHAASLRGNQFAFDHARRLNVDMLKLIQLGLTFTDIEGNLPRINGELCVWQFNFR